MSEPVPPGSPAFWNSNLTVIWHQDFGRIDLVFVPLTEKLMALAAAQPGESVLDIGGGAGTTSLALAEAVGPNGQVLLADVSKRSVDVAQQRFAKAGFAYASAEVMDISAHAFPPASFDLAFSRFGVMFFADPTAAFANLRGAMRPGGRLAFACFRTPADNPWTAAPAASLRAILPPQPLPDPLADPLAPGQFAFADGERVRGILLGAGWHHVNLTAHDPVMMLGSAQNAAENALRFGAPARALEGATDALRASARATLVAFFRGLETDGQVRMPGGIWLVTAQA